MESLSQKTFAPGQTIFRLGDTTTDLFHIVSGRVGISISRGGGDLLLAELGPGALFGEMALINGPPRTATATALEAVTVSIIPEAIFRQNALGLPDWALSIARVLAERLKNTTTSLDRMVDEKAHSVASSIDEGPATVSIVPHRLEIAYYPQTDSHRLFLAGLLDVSGAEELVQKINDLRRQRITPVILSFSNVVDVQRKALDLIVDLAKSSNDSVGRVQLENVQFIAERLQKLEGLQEILHTVQAPLRRVGFGDTLIRQGEEGTEMYVVKTGSFKVARQAKDKEVILWTAEEGDVIGEMALISGKVRSASVVANRSSQVYVINLADFQKNAYQIPKWFLSIIEGLVTRLRDTNKKLDSFFTGSLRPIRLSSLIYLEIFENIRTPGECHLVGSLVGDRLATLKTYLTQRFRQGVRRFHLDLSAVETVDAEAAQFLKRLHRTLLNAHGSLELTGALPQEPSDFDPPDDEPSSRAGTAPASRAAISAHRQPS